MYNVNGVNVVHDVAGKFSLSFERNCHLGNEKSHARNVVQNIFHICLGLSRKRVFHV